MNNFTKASEKERVALQTILPLTTNYTDTNSFKPYDAVSLINGKKYIIEAKVRDRHYNDLLLETKKYNSLLELSQTHSCAILYIVFTPVGTYIFNLTELKETHPELFKTSILNCPKQTMGNNQKIDKSVILLDIQYSKQKPSIF
jgi:hypothetical protein